MEGRQRITLHDRMSANDTSRDSLASLTLNDILANQKREAAAEADSRRLGRSRTLLDIIKEDETNKKDRKSWKAIKDKLRLKRAGSAWTSTVHIPASDIPIPNPNNTTSSQFSFQTHPNSDESTHLMTHQPDDAVVDPDNPAPITRAQFSRRNSTRFGSPSDAAFAGGESSGEGPKLRPQMSRRNSSRVQSFRRERVVTFRDSFDGGNDDGDGGGGSEGESNPETRRALSAREAVAAQEASEAAAALAAEETAAPASMSLMDLLEETDRQMGLEGSRYRISDDENDEDDDEDGNGGGGGGGGGGDGGEGGVEYNCCVCMVRHKGAAFIPCGHTFCRMCSRELWVSRANCPLCNNFILEILDIF